MNKSLENEVTVKVGFAIIVMLLIVSTITIVDFRRAQFEMVRKEISEIIEKKFFKAK